MSSIPGTQNSIPESCLPTLHKHHGMHALIIKTNLKKNNTAVKGTHANTTATSLLALCMLGCALCSLWTAGTSRTFSEPESPLSFPRCWAHCQPCEVRGALPGADAGHGRSTDCTVCALRPCAAWSLQCGVSVIQILQALQARDNTARPARSESNFVLLTSHHLLKLHRVPWLATML